MAIKYSYDSVTRNILLLDENDLIIREIDTQISLLTDYKLEDYSVKLLYNNSDQCTENSIFQVMVKKLRVGWLFPIQAIHSREHDYCNNEHFLKYAYVAWCYLIEKCKDKIVASNEFDLFEEYPQYTNILVLCNENCNMCDFIYERYIVSLFQYGYSEIGKGNMYTCELDSVKQEINLKEESKELQNTAYLRDLFKTTIVIEESRLGRFYLYYQVIEILIARIFDIRFKSFLNDLDVENCNLYDQKERLIDLSNERKRITLLFSDFSEIDTNTKADLADKCKKLLLSVEDEKDHNEVADLLYDVRCLLVHRMYILKEENLRLLKDVDDIFLDIIIQLILSFRVLPIYTNINAPINESTTQN